MKKRVLIFFSLYMLLAQVAIVYAARGPIPAGFPNANNTGLKGVGLTVNDLTVYTGSNKFGTNNTVFEKMSFPNGVTITNGAHVTFKKCFIGGGKYGVDLYSGSVTVEDCTFKGCCNKERLGAAIRGGNGNTVRRCDISGFNDGIKLYPNTLVEDSYIHDLNLNSVAHNDGMQAPGQTHNVTVRHNTVFGVYKKNVSAIKMTSVNGPDLNVHFEYNYFSGGQYSIWFHDKPGDYPNAVPPGPDCSLSNNIFEKDSYIKGPVNLSGTLVVECNYFHTGTAIPSSMNKMNSGCDINKIYAYKSPPPTAEVSFTGTPYSGTAPMTVQFTNTSTGSYTSWLWDFGDGATSTAQAPSHIYSQIGTYSVTLTGSNTGGSSKSITQTNYIDVRDPSLQSLTLEAESMTLSNGYIIDTGAKLNGTAIVVDATLTAPATGTAIASFSGTSGIYDVILSAIAENDGQPTVKLFIAGVEVINEILPLDSKNIDYTARTEFMAKGVAINQGDEIKIEGTSDRGTGYAGARVDNITFLPTGSITALSPIERTDNGPRILSYPHPMTMDSRISFAVGSPGFVSLKLYTLNGTEVHTLAAGKLTQGTHQVELVTDELESGIYVTRLSSEQGLITKEVMIIK